MGAAQTGHRQGPRHPAKTVAECSLSASQDLIASTFPEQSPISGKSWHLWLILSSKKSGQRGCRENSGGKKERNIFPSSCEVAGTGLPDPEWKSCVRPQKLHSELKGQDS